MKCSSIVLAYIAFFFIHIASAQNGLIESIRRIGSIENGDTPFDSEQYLSASELLLKNWDAASEDDQARFSMKMFLVHYRRSSILASRGNFDQAAEELRAEADLQNKFGARLENSTKSPDTFFAGLTELQAQFALETGSDPLAGRVGYSFERDGDGFTAARFELGDDVAGITVPEIKSEEALALVYRISRQGGRFVASAPKWYVVPKGRLPDVLKQAKREVEFDSKGKMTVQTLRTESSTKSTTNLDSGKTSSHLPQVVLPPTPTKAPDTKLPAPSDEPTSSIPWSMIVVMVLAAIGLLLFLLKKKKVSGQ